MPKRNILFVVAVIVILIVGAVLFMIFGKSSGSGEAADKAQTSQASSAPKEYVIKNSIRNLIASGKNVTCTFKTGVDQNLTNGTVFVADKKMRGDFEVTGSDSKKMESHMIQDGELMYFWSSASPTGTKMKISSLPQVTPSPNAQTQNADLDREMDMKCSSWVDDNSKFIAPSNVKFMDVSTSMMKTQTQSDTAGKTSSGASHCDAVQDTVSKAACVKAMNGSGY